MKETFLRLAHSRRVWIACVALTAPFLSRWLTPETLHNIKELAEVLIAALTAEAVAEKLPLAPKGQKLVPDSAIVSIPPPPPEFVSVDVKP